MTEPEKAPALAPDALRDVKLHYIDKVHLNLTAVGAQINTVMIFVVVLSLLLLGLVSGWLTIDRAYEAGGFKITLAQELVIGLTSASLALLSIHLTAISYKEEELRDTIIRLYAEIGFSDRSLTDLESNPLEATNIITSAFSSRLLQGSRFGNAFRLGIFPIFLILVFVLPLVAQVMAVNYAWDSPHSRWWLLVLCGPAVLLHPCYLLGLLLNERNKK